MPRRQRPQFAALWHLMNRGVLQTDIFHDDRDRARFLEILSEVVFRFGWVVHAFCEMTNHFHLLVETPFATVSRGMQLLEGWYGTYFNARWNRIGHLFERRAPGVIVQRESHLAEVIRYLVLNPVRARMVRLPEEWRWSSYRATAGLVDAPPFLDVASTRALFGGDSPEALARFREYVRAGIGAASPWERSVNGILGDDHFVRDVKRRLLALPAEPGNDGARANLRMPDAVDVLQAVVAVTRTTPASLRAGRSEEAVLAFALLAQTVSRATLPEIASFLGVSGPTAHRRCRDARARADADPDFRDLLARVREHAELMKGSLATTGL